MRVQFHIPGRPTHSDRAYRLNLVVSILTPMTYWWRLNRSDDYWTTSYGWKIRKYMDYGKLVIRRRWLNKNEAKVKKISRKGIELINSIPCRFGSFLHANRMQQVNPTSARMPTMTAANMSQPRAWPSKRNGNVTISADTLLYDGPATVRLSAFTVYNVPRINPFIVTRTWSLASSTNIFKSVWWPVIETWTHQYMIH